MIISAKYSNPDNTALIVTTDTHGDVLVGPYEVWWDVIHKAVPVAPYVPPTAPDDVHPGDLL